MDEDSLSVMLRRYTAEFIGTFALVFFGCGTRDMIGDTTNFAGIFVVHLAFGFTVAVMIYTLAYLSSAHFGASTPKIGILPAIVIEIVLTFFLMFVSMATATDKRFKRAESGLTVGFTILVCGLMANSLSGASMNPARSLAPALFAGGSSLAIVWIYFIGPPIGALLGAMIYEAIRGSQEFAKGVLDDSPIKREQAQ